MKQLSANCLKIKASFVGGQSWAKSDAFQVKEKVLADDRQTHITSWEAEKRTFEVAAGNETNARIATFYYPLWQATVNGKPVEVGKDENGAILIPVGSENSTVELYFQEPVKVKLASVLSLLTWLFLGLGLTIVVGAKMISSGKILKQLPIFSLPKL